MVWRFPVTFFPCHISCSASENTVQSPLQRLCPTCRRSAPLYFAQIAATCSTAVQANRTPFSPVLSAALHAKVFPSAPLNSCIACQKRIDSPHTDTSSKTVVTQSKPTAFPSSLRAKRSEVQTISEGDVQTTSVIDTPCEKCGRPQVRYYTQQLRSADEGSTVFYECDCGHKYGRPALDIVDLANCYPTGGTPTTELLF